MKLQIDELGFVGINVEDWNINRSYRKLTITTDYNTWITYVSRKNVPAGIPLTNDEYWKPILKGNGSLENIIRRLDELERKVAYYHPEGDTVESITWTGYSVSPSTVPVGLAATFIPGTVTAVYKSGRQEDVTSSAVFNAHRGSIADHTYIAPSTAGEDTIRASYSGKIADSILTVTIEEAVITDYYVGWTTGTKAQFASKTDSEMVNGATGFSSVVNPNYTHAFGSNNIFYLMYQANKAPRKVTLTSGGQSMEQDLVNDNTCPHNDVTIDGIAYKVFGIRTVTGYDQADTMTVNF